MPPKFKTDTFLVFAALFFLLATLLPFLILSFYNAPLADDYVYAHEAIDKGLLKSQTFWYFHWTGRYFATLLLSASPLYLNWTAGSALVPVAAILGLCVSLYYFVRSFTILKRSAALVLFVLFVLLYLSNLHTISQAFYWMPGLHTYITGIILFLFVWGYFIRVYNGVYRASAYNYLIPFALLVMMMGTSEVMIFYNNYIAFIVLGYCYFNKKDKLGFASFIFIVSLVFGLISLLAPGNFNRQSFTTSENVNYFLQAKRTLDLLLTKLLPNYIFNIPFILATLFIVLFISKEKASRPPADKLKIKPLFLFAFLFGGFLVTFLPHAIANTSELRAFNFSYFTFLLAVIITVVYLAYYYNLPGYLSLFKLKSSLAGPSFFLLLVLVSVFPKNNILQAYHDVFSEQPSCYLNELTARHNYLNEQRGKTFATVEPLTCQPKSLFFVDASPEIKDWKNMGYEVYFKIDTVIVARHAE